MSSGQEKRSKATKPNTDVLLPPVQAATKIAPIESAEPFRPELSWSTKFTDLRNVEVSRKEPVIETPLEIPRRKVGRPAGKRSDPNYERLTVLVRKDIRKMAERTWEDRTTSKDMSEMVEWLLIQYLANPQIFESAIGTT